MDLFMVIRNIEVKECDILPKSVCRICVQQLEDISLFIDKCKNNDTILKKNCSTLKEQESIKCETSDINDSDNGCNLPQGQHVGSEINYEVNTTLASEPQENKQKAGSETSENLRKHVLTHKGVKPFICELCGKGFLRKRSLDEHMNFHTGQTPYVCVYCGEGFKRLSDRSAHIYHIHNINTENVPKYKRKYTEKRVHLNIECKICGKIFASRSGYANHQLIHKGVKKFLCNICGKKYITNPALQIHMRMHTGEKPFRCTECGKSFGHKNLLNVYMLNMHTSQRITDMLNCPHCDKKYHTKSGLNNHILTHTDEKPLECSECNKRFYFKNALHNHLLDHRDQKPHKCILCGKSFVSPSHLKVHMRLHSGEKCYPCLICGKQLAQSQTLKVHMRQHTGETPYVCSVCNKGYHDSSNLKRHFSRHHGGDNSVKKSVIVKNDATF